MGIARASAAALAVGVGLVWAAPAWADVEFDPVPLTTTPDVQEIVLENDGDDPFELDRPGITGADAGAFRVVSEDCSGWPLYPGEECGIEVRFTPSRVGLHRAVLEVPFVDGEEPLRIDLSGEGTPALRVTPARVDFGSLPRPGAPSKVDLTVQNVSDEEIDFGLFTPAASWRGFMVGPFTCLGFKLAPGASCTVTVGFIPRTAGAYSSELRFRRSAGTLATVPLSGTYAGRPASPKPPEPPPTAQILSTRLGYAVRQWRHSRRGQLRKAGFLLTGFVAPADGKLELTVVGRHAVARGVSKLSAGKAARLLARPTRKGARLLRLDRNLRLRVVLRFTPSSGGPASRVAAELGLPSK